MRIEFVETITLSDFAQAYQLLLGKAFGKFKGGLVFHMDCGDNTVLGDVVFHRGNFTNSCFVGE